MDAPARDSPFGDFIGGSTEMRRVFSTIERVASTEVDVLIRGETGTGKELVARAIHNLSSRRSAPLVPVDCGAIPENLLESELFGYERGAFTGADRRRTGLLEAASGGTFFMDEVAELPVVLQAKLLRTLQERRFRRLGSNDEVAVDVRVVAATSRDLDAMVERREFREDLYYRINVVRIDLPPLRERGDDLGLMAEAFAERFSREMGRPVVAISPEAWAILSRHDWPGNIRELQNVIRRAIAMSETDRIEPTDLPVSLLAAVDSRESETGQGFFDLRNRHIAHFEREYLSNLLDRHAGNVRAAAEEARLPRGTMYRLLKTHSIDPSHFRGTGRHS